jgi:SAM-dependent methyltransferase
MPFQSITQNEGIRVEEVPLCRLCSQEGDFLYKDLRDRLFGVSGVWSLRRCPKCSLVWLDPRPVSEDVGKLYERYLTHDVTNFVPVLAGLRSRVRDAILAGELGYGVIPVGRCKKLMGRVVARIRPIKELVELNVMTLEGTPRGKLLDVGCGNGQFLVKMEQLGWETTGVEFDDQAVKVARERFSLNVHGGSLQNANFTSQTFDAITMNHVIEHLLDPIDTLRECYRILKPGGKIVVVTPNIESLGHWMFGKCWYALDPPRHLWLFSLGTLRACLELAKFRIVILRTGPRQARTTWRNSSLIRRNGCLPGGFPEKVGLSLHAEGFIFQGVEHFLCQLGNVGEELVLVATRGT